MPAIYLIGDSTVQADGDPFYGWGSLLQPFCREGVTVCNYARSGESSRSFYERGLFDPVSEQIKPDDLLLIQFGHNDEKDDPQRHTDPQDSYQDFLGAYLDAALQKNALAVLVTPVCRRHFLPDGSLLYTHGEYPLAVRKLAAQRGVPLIDLKRMTRELYLCLGQEKTGRIFVQIPAGSHPDFPQGHDDLTHFCREGARRIAALAADAMAGEETLAEFVDTQALIEFLD